MYSAHIKLNIALFSIIALLLCADGYMGIKQSEAIDALNNRIDDKQLLCKQVHEIKSKLNHVLECMEINK